MKIIEEININNLIEPIRFNTYCETHINFFNSKKSVKKAIKKGEIRLNNTLVHGGTWLKKGDLISIIDLELTLPKSYHLKIKIVFEDEYLAILNKPAGLTVSGNQFKTLFNTLSYNLKESNLSDKLAWPLPVHRLDNQTSGLIVIAKTKTARKILGDIFEKKLIKKEYHAIVMGKPNNSGQFSSFIQNKKAITDYQILRSVKSLKNEWLTLVQLHPLTGRTHQLRIQLSENGTPIYGDKLYSTKTIKHKGLFLAATGLIFNHPITNVEIGIKTKIPNKFQIRLEREEKQWRKFN